jgi:hypothetical protein
MNDEKNNQGTWMFILRAHRTTHCSLSIEMSHGTIEINTMTLHLLARSFLHCHPLISIVLPHYWVPHSYSLERHVARHIARCGLAHDLPEGPDLPPLKHLLLVVVDGAAGAVLEAGAYTRPLLSST